MSTSPWWRSPLLRWVVAAALLALGAYRALRDVVGVPEPDATNTDSPLGADFRDATYFPVKEFLAGGQPYEPAAMFANWPVGQEFGMYLPFHLTLQIPFSLLPYRAALVAYGVVSLVLFAVIAVLAARAARVPGGPSAWALVAGLVLMSQWAKWNVYVGQVLPFVALGVVVAVLAAGRRPWWAAFGVALAWIKPQFAIPLVVLLLVRGRWREAVGGTLLAGVLSLPAGVIVIARAGGLPEFLAVVGRNLAYSRSADYSTLDSAARVDLASALARLTGTNASWLELVCAVVVLLLAGLALGRRRGPLAPAELLLVTVAIQLSIYHIVNEGVMHLAGAVAILTLWWGSRRPGPDEVADRRPGPTRVVVGCAVLVLLPALFLHHVTQLAAEVIGEHALSLVEPTILVVVLIALSGCLLRDGAPAGRSAALPDPL